MAIQKDEKYCGKPQLHEPHGWGVFGVVEHSCSGRPSSITTPTDWFYEEALRAFIAARNWMMVEMTLIAYGRHLEKSID